MNIWLIIVACIVPFLIIACAFYFLVYFSSPDDKYQAWLPKIVVVAGLSLACFSILLLPLDVANNNSQGGLNLDITWQILYAVIALFVVVIIPFFIFYYEADDPDLSLVHQIKWGIIYTAVTIVISGIILGILYGFLGFADIGYTELSSPITSSRDNASPTCSDCTSEGKHLTIRASIIIYIVALISLVGWGLFIVCGGCGMTALPVGCITSFIYRPRRLTLKEYSRLKTAVNKRTNELMEIGQEIEERQKSGKGKRKTRKMYNMFKQAVLQLETDWQELEKSYKDGGGSPIWPFCQLLLGIVFSLVSLLWILHIILYLSVPPPHGPIIPFLNSAFIWLDGIFSLFGTAAYGLFAFYLLFALVAGTVKVSEFTSWFAIHPLKVGDTMMNSFLFNTGIILVGSVTITQFVTYAFASYARLTAVAALFSTYIRNLRYIHWVFFALPYAFLVCSLLGMVLVFICFKISDKDKRVDKLKDAAAALREQE